MPKELEQFKTEDLFAEGKEIPFYIYPSFKERFYGMDITVPEKVDGMFKRLERDMTDTEIQDEMKPVRSTLGDIYSLIKNKRLSKDGLYQFYVEGKNGEVFSVGVRWPSDDRQWRVCEWKLGDGGFWFADNQVLCSGNIDTQTLEKDTSTPFQNLPSPYRREERVEGEGGRN